MCSAFPNIEKIFILLAALILGCPPSAGAAEHSKRYYHRVAQTLIDAERGISSAGRIYVGEKEAEELFSGEQWQSKSYIKSHFGDKKEILGTFKIIVGLTAPPRKPSSLWKPVTWPGKKVSGAQLWSRPVTISKKRYHEFFARHTANDLALEMTMLYGDLEKGRRDAARRFTDFIQNASVNGLYAPEPAIKISGRWSGEMVNSRGEKTGKSTLSLAESTDGKISGVWHAGWKLQNAKKDGEIVTWEHNDIQDGCRNYKNRMELQDGGASAVLTYTVADRCREPRSYDGRVNLRRMTSS